MVKRRIARCTQLAAPAWKIQASAQIMAHTIKPTFQADNINQPAAQRLENGVSELKGTDNPGVLFGGDAEAGFQFRCQNAQRVTGDVVHRHAE
jgi:hypothetical protein